MRNLSLVIALSGLLLISAGPSLRGLQQADPVVVDNTTTPIVVSPPPIDNTTVVIPPPVDNSTSTNSTSTNGTNSTSSGNTTNSTANTNPYPGYTAINVSDPDAAWYNDQVYGAFKHGVNALVQTAIFQGRAPVALYNVTNWIGAWYRNRSSGASYKFYCTLKDSRGINIIMNLTVAYNARTNVNTLGSYNYRVTNIPRNSFPSAGYKYLTPAQIHNNTILQGALRYGAVWMIQYLVDANKIPATDVNYTMYGLPYAVSRIDRNGTSYKFHTQNQNDNGVHVDTNVTVYYRNSDKSYNVTAYSYNGYGYNNSELANNTNASNSTQNITEVVNSTTVTIGTENVTVVGDQTVVSGSANSTAVSQSSSDNSTTTTTNTTTNSTGSDASDDESDQFPQVTVDISLVTAYNDTLYQTPLVVFNPPAVQAEGSDLSDDSNTDASDSTVVVNDTTVAGAIPNSQAGGRRLL